MANFELNNFKLNAELNSVKPSMTITEKSPMVEIFSAMVNGTDTSKYGEKADRVYSQIKKLATEAEAGNARSKVELNTITSLIIQTPLLQRLQLFNFMGNVINVGYDEKILYKRAKLQGKMSNFQASQGDVTFPNSEWNYTEMTTQTISGGMSTNYRQILTGNLDSVGFMQEQVVTDMTNKVFYKVVNDLYTAIKTAGGIKRFVEATPITKTAIDTMIKEVRRYGKVGIFGDFSVTSQINDMTGFTSNTAGTTVQLPVATIEQIMQTGLIQSYKGTMVTEIPNTYNELSLNAAGTDFATYLPEGLLFFLIAGQTSPLQIGFRGGLTSKSGFDVISGNELTRFD